MDHMDQKRFEEAKRKIIGVDRQRLDVYKRQDHERYTGSVT